MCSSQLRLLAILSRRSLNDVTRSSLITIMAVDLTELNSTASTWFSSCYCLSDFDSTSWQFDMRHLHLTDWWASNNFTECYIIHEFEGIEHCVQVVYISVKKKYRPNHVPWGIPSLRVLHWDTVDPILTRQWVEGRGSKIIANGLRWVWYWNW